MSKISSVIEKLDFDKSEQLLLKSNMYNDFSNVSPKFRHIITTLKPYAVYFSESKPLIAFFDVEEIDDIKDFYKKIWNSQIPIIIIEENSIVKIYNGCFLNKEHELNIVEQIKIESANRFSAFSFWNITSEDFWKRYEKDFSQPKLDISLLENIKYITNFFKNGICEKFSNKLILRLIFIRFLIDRGIDLDFKNLSNNIKESQKEFLKILGSKQELYSLFNHLKERFNGNLFDLYPDEFNLISEEDLKILHEFFSGNLDMSSGQYSLFPLYDFNIIPVELISNIYERFLGIEKQKEDSAFYTPPYLVDYIVKDSIFPFLQTNKECKVLDPSCGSGIFLVQTLRAIIEKNIDKDGYCYDDEKIVNMLKNNIYGIDKNNDAIDVAIFSLYLTLLDYKNPKTLKSFILPKLKNENFLVMDFFDKEVNYRFQNIKFDFILGNPPWGRAEGLHIDYCKQNKYALQNKEISRSFIYRTGNFSKKSTKCILIVTSKLLYNIQKPSKIFRKWLLENCKIEKIIELSPVRELIFKNAKCPAIIIKYNFDSMKLDNEIMHITLLPNLFFKLFNIIMIERNNIKKVKQKYLVDYDWLWKTIVFGCGYDFENILFLKENYPSLKETIENEKLLYGTGLQLSGDSKDATSFFNKEIISAKSGIGAFYIDFNYCKKFNQTKVHRNRNENIFNPPYVLLKKGFDINTYKLRAVYTEKELLYTDAITGIKGSKAQKQLLLSIVGNLNSSLYAYLNLMLGSSSGIEREQSFTSNVLEFPFCNNNEISLKVEEIQKMKMNKSEEFIINEAIIENKIHELDKLILEEFHLNGNNFIDYALNVQLAQISNNYIYRKVQKEDILKYADIFIKYFKNIFDDEEMHFHITCTMGILNKYCEFKFELIYEKPIEIIEFDKVIDENKFLGLFVEKKFNDLFYQNNDIMDFGENYFRIIKFEEYKNWHPACAEIDLSRVVNEIFLGEGK